MRILDAHCHIGQGCNYSQTPEELLARMDANNVEHAVVVPVDRCIAVDNEEGNNTVLRAAKLTSDRLIPFATVNPWYGSRAIDELNRSFAEGAAGLKLHPVLQGFSIIDEICFPVVEAAIEQDKPVYFHTGTPVHSAPFQLSELAMRYPQGRFIMGHAAYADYWNDVVASAQCAPNIIVETSQHLASFVKTLYDELGADRLVYGSDAPKTAMDVEIAKITLFIPVLDDVQKILGGNMSALLGRQP